MTYEKNEIILIKTKIIFILFWIKDNNQFGNIIFNAHIYI